MLSTTLVQGETRLYEKYFCFRICKISFSENSKSNLKKYFDLQKFSFYNRLTIFNDHNVFDFSFYCKNQIFIISKFTQKRLSSKKIFSHVEMCDFSFGYLIGEGILC